MSKYKDFIFIIILILIFLLLIKIDKKNRNTDYQILLNNLKHEKEQIIKEINNTDSKITQIYSLIQQKDNEINKKENEINKLKKIIYEKADSVYSFDNQQTFSFLSKWLSENN